MENIIGNDIRRRRIDLDKSVRGLAKEVQISAAYLSQIERGQVPPPQTLCAIYLALEKGIKQYPDNSDVNKINAIVSSNPCILYVFQKLSETGYSIWVPTLFKSYFLITSTITDRQLNSTYITHLNTIRTVIQDLTLTLESLSNKTIPVILSAEERLLEDFKLLFMPQNTTINIYRGIADQLGITTTHLNDLIYGNKIPSDDLVNRMVALLNKYSNTDEYQQYLNGKKFSKDNYFENLPQGIYGIRIEVINHPYVVSIIDTFEKLYKNDRGINLINNEIIEFICEQIYLLPAELPDLNDPDSYLELFSEAIINTYRKFYRIKLI